MNRRLSESEKQSMNRLSPLILLVLLITAPVRAENLALEAAARLGLAWAQYQLGNNYYAGDDDYPVNKRMAAHWYMKAALSGHEKAQLSIGIAYRRGQGIEQDDQAARMWMTKSAMQLHGLAMYNLAILEHDLGDLDEAYAWALIGTEFSSEGQYKVFCERVRMDLHRKVSPSDVRIAQETLEKLRCVIRNR